MLELNDGTIVPEENFDSHLTGEGGPPHIDPRLIPMVQVLSPILMAEKKFTQTKNKTCIHLLLLEMHARLQLLEKYIEEVYQNAHKIRTSTYIIKHENLISFNIKKEQIIHIMKRYIDDIIIILCIEYDTNFENTKIIKYTSIGSILSDKKTCYIKEKIRKHLNFEIFKDLFTVINDLHNAYKHTLLLSDSRTIYTTEGVAFSVLYTPQGDISKMKFLNHTLYHVKKSFNDFLLSFFDVKQPSATPTIVHN